MSWNLNSHGLPFLPGYTFRDLTKSDFRRPQTLEYINGFAFRGHPAVGIGQEPLSEQLIEERIRGLSMQTHDQSPMEEFIPAHVALDKKILCFDGYFKEDVLFSHDEEYRVRPVNIYYYLEDDTMSMFEPPVDNSGIPQGMRIKRHRMPKNQQGDHYLWKDLNLGMVLDVYGVQYHITQCSTFTKEFMEREGIILNEPEPTPVDPYTQGRKKAPPSHTTPSAVDRTHQLLSMDRKVLRFFALWDDPQCPEGDTRSVKIQYFLSDDSVEIREVHKRNSGREPIPVLMRRKRLPKKFRQQFEDFPRCFLEVSTEEVEEYYSPKDFQVGQTVMLLGRPLMLYDCDDFTKEYFQKNHPDLEMKPIEIPKEDDEFQERKEMVPPYNGFGIPKPLKKNVLKMLENNRKVLRYTARLDSRIPKDQSRRFILSYYVSDDMISIFEMSSRNSGIIGGKFLEKTRVPKPGSTTDNPEFYSPADFAIGATVEVFSHRFVLTDADRYVLTYLQSNSSQIPLQTLESVQQKLGVEMANEKPAEENAKKKETPDKLIDHLAKRVSQESSANNTFDSLTEPSAAGADKAEPPGLP